MKLSVIIVNYNVKFFLEQCLNSVFAASGSLGEIEVIVVDNNSVDGSVEMLKEKFPQVNTLANTDNKGFSAANNQGIKISSGEYVLLLNPDTIVEEDTFKLTVEFMDSKPIAGGLGVKMIDGNGAFLPESKRGLPTPWAAFCKMCGLSRLFPSSKLFNRYHLGYLNKDEIHEVDILSGAFMMLRRTALDKTGLLDEEFFMYGEDIDLSYRLTKDGYQNFYFPKTRIIHYKGESTKKGSLNYVFVFYNAMVIFARKHFTQNNALLFSRLIKAAIYFRASLSVSSRVILRMILPVLDAVSIFGGMLIIRDLWVEYVMISDGPYYPPEFMQLAVPSYIFIWLSSVFINGGYDKPIRYLRSVSGIILGTLLILIIYALLPESWRSSRALILIGAAWASVSTVFLRFIFKSMRVNAIVGDQSRGKNLLVIGNEIEAGRVLDLLNGSESNPNVKGWVSSDPLENSPLPAHLGSLSQLNEISRVHKIDEIVFCIKDLPISEIITNMATLEDRKLTYKIAPPESMYLIGSSAISTSQDRYMIELSDITKQENQRIKRLVDLMVSIGLLFLSPILIFISGNPLRLFTNLFSVLFGIKSMVGYAPHTESPESNYPKIKPGILNPSDVLKDSSITQEDLHDLNLHYAKDYSIAKDLLIISRGLTKLGRD
ncbi:MAG: glycosyltransferase [Flavobacteriales bacterium]|nr:glycosyltransferase [Flavobacteriales bacterium]